MNWKSVWEEIYRIGASWGLKLVGALAVLVIGLRLIKWVKKRLAGAKKLDRTDGSVRSFLVSCTGVALYTALFLTVAMMLGIPTTSFLTALASAGVAIGLALQGALSNFAGGIMILIFKPFRVGDYITTEKASGTVDAITVVYTVLRTVDNKHITVPNGTLMNAVVENHSAEKLRRVDIDFGVAYSSDTERVKALLIRTAAADGRVLADPAPFAALTRQDDSALVFTLRAWCKTEDYWDVRFALTESVKKAFDANGVEIPFPQMDVHVK